jgi:glycosyltransferase involved in cell wall biosynthesis
MGKPIITGYSKASAELFKHRESILFTEFANPKALAESILYLHEDYLLRKKIGSKAREIFLANLTPKKVVRSILSNSSKLN